MLYTTAIMLFNLLLPGPVTSTTIGGCVHNLLVIVIVVIPLRVVGGRKISSH